jgi:hypothetical protein
MKQKPVWPIVVPAVLAGLILVMVRRSHEPGQRPITIRSPTHPVPRHGMPPRTPEELRRQARSRCQARLDWADSRTQSVLTEPLRDLDAFFAEAGDRTPRFTERVLSWESKGLYLVDRLPWARGGRHDEFLRRAFHDCLFAPAELEAQLGRVIQAGQEALDGLEGELSVRLGRDLADLSAAPPLVLPDRAGLHAALEQALAQAAARTGASLRDDVGRELVAVLVGGVLTRAARGPRVPVGLLGAGLATWPISGGFGLIAALIVDQVSGVALGLVDRPTRQPGVAHGALAR